MESNQPSSITFAGINDGFQNGINYGSITANIHPALGNSQRPETPPSPVSTVPFYRDSEFTSRVKLLGRIDEQCSIPGLRIALFGLGGVGKSQLAIEYTYRIRDKLPTT